MFNCTTEDGKNADFWFTLDSTFMVADLVGKTLEFSAYQEVMYDCPGKSSGGFSDEPTVLAEAVLRDTNGELLVLDAPSTPTEADGKILRSDLAPEISARWVEVPDAPCEQRSSALELTAATGEKVTASSEQRAEVSIGGAMYVLAVATITKPEESGYCGAVKWVLYRKDILIPE